MSAKISIKNFNHDHQTYFPHLNLGHKCHIIHPTHAAMKATIAQYPATYGPKYTSRLPSILLWNKRLFHQRHITQLSPNLPTKLVFLEFVIFQNPKSWKPMFLLGAKSENFLSPRLHYQLTNHWPISQNTPTWSHDLSSTWLLFIEPRVFTFIPLIPNTNI